MISKALQSLDAWLAQAEEVLAEQATYLQSQHGPDVHLSQGRSKRSFQAER
jgi:hypothetical protein